MNDNSNNLKEEQGQSKHWLVIIIASALFIFFLGYIAWYIIQPSTPSERKDYILLLTQIVGGVALFIGLLFTWRNLSITQEATSNNLKNARETLRITQEGRITERFSKAIEQLGSDKLEIKLGGIYSLERIARDSERDHWTVMEVLTTYLRERSPWTEEKESAKNLELQAQLDDNAFFKQLTTHQTPVIPADVQAILTVIGRRTLAHEKNGQRLNLCGTDLRRASLSGAHLERAHLNHAHLEKADLHGAYLSGANLAVAYLEEANLSEAKLDEAYLVMTHFEGTNLQEADFNSAIMQITFLLGANLQGCRNLDTKQLSEVWSLFGANLDESLKNELERNYPHLLELPQKAQ